MARRRRKQFNDSNTKDTIRRQIARARQDVLEGIVVCIDPGSGSRNSNAGYAVFNCGKLIESGLLFTPSEKKLDVIDRLRGLDDKLRAHLDIADVLVIEKIRGKSHTYLRWSCAVVLCALRAPVVLEVSPYTWHRYAPEGYVKSDDGDARQMGYTTIRMAMGEI